MGGHLAFEMARLLQAQGEKVALVAMFQSNHPANYPNFLPSATLLRRLLYSVIDRIDYEMSNLRTLEPKGKLSYISEKIKTLMTVTQVKIEKMIESFLVKLRLSIPHSRSYKLTALYEAHDKAFVSYEPRSYQGRVAIFRASKQPLGIYPDPALGWGELIEAELELHEIPGHHINIIKEPSVQILAEKLRTCLDEAEQMI